MLLSVYVECLSEILEYVSIKYTKLSKLETRCKMLPASCVAISNAHWSRGFVVFCIAVQPHDAQIGNSNYKTIK